jgi:hypothetical protein
VFVVEMTGIPCTYRRAGAAKQGNRRISLARPGYSLSPNWSG